MDSIGKLYFDLGVDSSSIKNEIKYNLRKTQAYINALGDLETKLNIEIDDKESQAAINNLIKRLQTHLSTLKKIDIKANDLFNIDSKNLKPGKVLTASLHDMLTKALNDANKDLDVLLDIDFTYNKNGAKKQKLKTLIEGLENDLNKEDVNLDVDTISIDKNLKKKTLKLVDNLSDDISKHLYLTFSGLKEAITDEDYKLLSKTIQNKLKQKISNLYVPISSVRFLSNKHDISKIEKEIQAKLDSFSDSLQINIKKLELDITPARLSRLAKGIKTHINTLEAMLPAVTIDARIEFSANNINKFLNSVSDLDITITPNLDNDEILRKIAKIKALAESTPFDLDVNLNYTYNPKQIARIQAYHKTLTGDIDVRINYVINNKSLESLESYYKVLKKINNETFKLQNADIRGIITRINQLSSKMDEYGSRIDDASRKYKSLDSYLRQVNNSQETLNSNLNDTSSLLNKIGEKINFSSLSANGFNIYTKDTLKTTELLNAKWSDITKNIQNAASSSKILNEITDELEKENNYLAYSTNEYGKITKYLEKIRKQTILQTNEVNKLQREYESLLVPVQRLNKYINDGINRSPLFNKKSASISSLYFKRQITALITQLDKTTLDIKVKLDTAEYYAKLKLLKAQSYLFEKALSLNPNVNLSSSNLEYITKKILTLSAIIGALLPQVSALVTALSTSITGGVLLLPSVLSSIGIIVGTLYSAWNNLADTMSVSGKKMYKVIENLKERFSALKTVIQENYFQEFYNSFKVVSNNLVTQIEQTIPKLSRSLGNWTDEILKGFYDSLSAGGLASVINNISLAVDYISSSARTASKGLADIWVAGAKWLPSIGKWIAEIGDEFGKWASNIVSSGKFDKAIQASAASVKELWQILKNAYNVLKDFGKQLTSGGFGLEPLNTALVDLRNLINDGLSKSLQSFGKVSDAVFSNIFKYLNSISKALSPIIEVFLNDLQQNIINLEPYFAQASEGFKGVMEVASSSIQKVLDYFGKFSRTILTLIGNLQNLSGITSGLGLLFGTIFSASMVVLVQKIAASFLSLGARLVGVLTTSNLIIVTLLQFADVSTVVNGISAIFGVFIGVLSQLLNIVNAVINAIKNIPILGDVFSSLASGALIAYAGLKILVAIFPALKTSMLATVSMSGTLSGSMTNLKSSMAALGTQLTAIKTRISSLKTSFASMRTSLATTASTASTAQTKLTRFGTVMSLVKTQAIKLTTAITSSRAAMILQTAASAALTIGINIAAAAFRALALAIKAIPGVIVISLISMAISGLVDWLFKADEATDDLSDSLEDIEDIEISADLDISNAQDSAYEYKNLVKLTQDDVNEIIKSGTEDVSSYVSQMYGDLSSEAKTYSSEEFKALTENYQNVIDELKSFVLEHGVQYDTLDAQAKGVYNSLVTELQGYSTELADIGVVLESNFTNMVDTTSRAIHSSGGEIESYMKDHLLSSLNDVGSSCRVFTDEWVQALYDQEKATIDSYSKQLDTVEDFLIKYNASWTNGSVTVTGSVQEMWSEIKNALDLTDDEVNDLLATFISLNDGIGNSVAEIIAGTNTMQNELGKILQEYGISLSSIMDNGELSLESLYNTSSQAYAELVSKTGNSTNLLSEELQKMNTTLIESGSSLTQYLADTGEVWDSIAGDFTDTGVLLQSVVVSAMDGMKLSLENGLSTMRDLTDAQQQELIDKTGLNYATLDQIMNNTYNAIESNSNITWDKLVEDANKGQVGINDSSSQLATALDEYSSALTDMQVEVESATSGMYSAWANDGRAMGSVIKEVANEIEIATSKISNLHASFDIFDSSKTTQALTLVEGKLKSVSNTFNDTQNVVSNFDSKVSAQISSLNISLASSFASISKNVSATFDTIDLNFSNIFTKAKLTINSGFSTIKSTLANLSLKSQGEAIMKGFYNGLYNYFEYTIKPYVKSMSTWISNNKGPISYDRKLLVPHGKAIMEGFKEGLQTAYESSVKPLVSSIAGDIYKDVKNITNINNNKDYNFNIYGMDTSGLNSEQQLLRATRRSLALLGNK